MSRRGRKASLPPADHARPEPLGPDGLVVHHYNQEGRLQDYDFAELEVAEPMQRSLAVLFAAGCNPHRWTAHSSSYGQWQRVRRFTEYLSEQEVPPNDLDELTGAVIDRWWMKMRTTSGNRATFRLVATLLRGDERLQTGPVAEALARRIPASKSTTQSYSTADFAKIKTAARQTLRSALLRIEDSARHLERWRAGEIPDGSREFVVGEALDLLARTGDLPRYTNREGRPAEITKRYHKALGGTAAWDTWQRLFPTRMEAVALGVLLMAEYGWNLSVINRAVVPQASPDPGWDGHPTYRIPIEKRKRGRGRWFETENVTDHGADSPGRLITQALQVTRFSRAVVETLEPGTDRLVVWRSATPDHVGKDSDRHPPVGPFRIGLATDDARDWTKDKGLGGSPFRRGRRTVTAVERREPAQHSQESHDRHYVLPDENVQAAAVPVIAAGAEAAADQAREAVLVAELRDTRDPDDAETATADCHDAESSPFPAPDGGCGASFLLCLACPNARVHSDHHPRLAHLHEALGNIRSVLPTPTWQRDWGDAHARLEHLKRSVGDGGWAHALARVTDTDRELIDFLLTGDLNA
ncbi:hypothetical protein HHL19_35185 [Streptomyces sp. R302]|uniref:hypothetical protein n=1 Tax=unclassified Streptomyces TaxID=2593676 RepID=UPI00145F6D36|nr:MULTISPECIES: hypothetical protein [unclassified Streptomyces]NML54970.1 hypothetical protein [Streptomyces sp. R301]NML83757.1 hypothetical protein [Streptomyces sp. R302]